MNIFEQDNEIMKSYLGENSFDIRLVSLKASYKLTEDEKAYYQVRLGKAYPALKALYEQDFVAKNGFHPSQTFGIKQPFNMQKLAQTEKSFNQGKLIPVDQKLIDAAFASKKYFVASSKFTNEFDGQTQSNKVDYFACNIGGQILPVALVERVKSYPYPTKDSPIFEDKSINMYLLIRGRLPVYIYRYDLNPLGNHPNQMENGQLLTEKKTLDGPHEHIMSEKFGFMYPVGTAYAHADAQEAPSFSLLADAKDYVLDKHNFSYEKNQGILSAFDGVPFLRQEEEHTLFDALKQQLPRQTNFENFNL